MASQQEDGFQVVRRKRKKSKGKICIQSKLDQVEVPDCRSFPDDDIDIGKLRRRISECRTEFENSQFHQDFKRTLQSASEFLIEITSKNVDTDETTSESAAGNWSCRACQEKKKETSTKVDCACNLDRIGTFDCDEQHKVSEERTVSKCSSYSKFEIVDIVCYGLGNFSSCPIARYQCAMLLLLKDLLQIPGSCYCYDPRCTLQERDILQEMGCVCLEENEEGKRKVDKPTLFYMLHCGKPLYNNLLWANWTRSQMKNIIIIGNSFDSYKTRLPSRIFTEEVAYISRILPYTKEFSLDSDCGSYSDIFTDTSIHVFPDTKLSCLSNEFWQDCEEPLYENVDDVEIIMKK